jgi:hypothetical protein
MADLAALVPALTRCSAAPERSAAGTKCADAAVARQGLRAAGGARRAPVPRFARATGGRVQPSARCDRDFARRFPKIGDQPGSGALRAPLKM